MKQPFGRHGAAREMSAATSVRGRGRLTAEATAELEQRLHAAAESVFLEQGYASATMDGIAKAAAVTRRTLYARYANKAEVLEAVVDQLLDRHGPAFKRPGPA
jgi:AcrR family transcriptional regulator